MEKAFELKKDETTDVIPEPMTSLYEKPAEPNLLKEKFRSRYKK